MLRDFVNAHEEAQEASNRDGWARGAERRRIAKEVCMGRPPWTDEQRRQFQETMAAKKRGDGTLVAPQRLKAPPTDNGHDEIRDDYIPGSVRAAAGPHILLPTEVTFEIGRELADVANFVQMWKGEYANFRLNRAMTRQDEASTVQIVLSPSPKAST